MDVTVPVMETDFPEAEIIEVLVAVGDKVTGGQLLFVVAFDKANVEIPSPTDGEIVELSTTEGELVEPGQILATITPDST
ncbi:MAG: hypothetical protein BMS9Abin12_1325 [Acidimicrobiia bacterium]|nr:MAG: hypothetical protein BMS9Abin12_1325 [Acidimicrobiia bacterium]